MVYFLAAVCVILVLIVLDLRSRVIQLERAQRQLEAQNAKQKKVPVGAPAPIFASPIMQPVARVAETGPTVSSRMMAWVKEDWLLKLGALLLLIGFGWLTTYAFLHNWIGPFGRIMLGILAGAFFVVLGWWRIRLYINQGGVFMVLGSTVILLTIFAAREVYGFFTPLMALAAMFVTTSLVGIASVKYRHRILAFVSVVLAALAPQLIAAPEKNYVGLFAYLLVVLVGAIWIVLYTDRRELVAAALAMVALYSLPHWFGHTMADTNTLLLFAYAFTGIFFLMNTMGLLRLRDRAMRADLITAAANGLFVLVWVMFAAPEHWKSAIIAMWMVVFAVGGFVIYKISSKREPLYMYALVCIAMLGAATTVELHGTSLTIGFTVEAALISLAGHLIFRDARVGRMLCALFTVPMVLTLSSFTSPAWKLGIMHADFWVLLIFGVLTLGLGQWYAYSSNDANDSDARHIDGAITIVGSVYLYALLWLVLHTHFAAGNTAVIISLATYTIVGLLCYFTGLAEHKNGTRIYGGIMVGLVVLRLLMVDIWTMELAGRIVMFFLIGALLVSTAFIGRKGTSDTIRSA